MTSHRCHWIWAFASLALLGGCGQTDNPYHLPPMIAGHVRLDAALADANGVPAGTQVTIEADGVRVWLIEAGQAVDSALTEKGVYLLLGKQHHAYRVQTGIRPAFVDSTELILADRGVAYYPDSLRLHRSGDLTSRPNPFTGQVELRFQIATNTHAEITVYNLAAARVRLLGSLNLPAGTHAVLWDGRDDANNVVGDGMYWVLLQTDSETRAELVIKQP